MLKSTKSMAKIFKFIFAVRNLVLKIDARLTSIILKPAVSTAGLPKYPPLTSIIFTKHHIYTFDAVFL